MGQRTKVYPDIAGVFKKIRGDRTINQMAGQCKLGDSTWHALENGKSYPRKDTVNRIVASGGHPLGQPLSPELTQALYQVLEYPTQGEITHPVANQVNQALADQKLLPVVSDLLKESIQGVLKLWLTYDEAKKAQYARRWQDAASACAAAHTELQTLTSTLSAYLLDTQAAAQLHLGHIDEVRATHDRVAHQLEHVEDPRIMASHDMHRGDFHRDQGEWQLAETSYRAAQRRFAQLDDDTQEARCRRKLATVKLFQGDWHEADRHLQACLEKFLEQRDHYELAKTYYTCGWVYNISGDWEDATRHHSLGLEHTKHHNLEWQRQHLPPDDHLLMLANIYLGNDTRQAGNLPEAETYLTEALKLSEQLDDKRERGWIYLQLARIELLRAQDFEAKGELAKAKSRYTQSQDYFEQSDSFNRSINYLYRRAMTLVHYSQWHVARKEYRQAYARLRDAKAIAGDLGCRYYEAEIGIFLCDLLWRTGDPKHPLLKAGQSVEEQQRLTTFDIKTFRELAYEVEECHKTYSFHNFMARLRTIEAKVHLDARRFDEAAKFLARAFYHALNYNSHSVAEIRRTYQEVLERHRDQMHNYFVGSRQMGDAVLEELNHLPDPNLYPGDVLPRRQDPREGTRARSEVAQFLRETR